MKAEVVKRRNKKWLIVSLTVVSVVAVSVLYYMLSRGPHQVNSGLFKLQTVFRAHTGFVWAVQFSPDGNFLASGSIDSTVKLWRNNGEIFKNLKHPAGVTSLRFSPDGNFIASCSYDGKVRLWDLSTGSVVKEFNG